MSDRRLLRATPEFWPDLFSPLERLSVWQAGWPDPKQKQARFCLQRFGQNIGVALKSRLSDTTHYFWTNYFLPPSKSALTEVSNLTRGPFLKFSLNKNRAYFCLRGVNPACQTLQPKRAYFCLRGPDPEPLTLTSKRAYFCLQLRVPGWSTP